MRKRVAALAAAGLGLTAIALAIGSGPRATQAPPLRAERDAPTSAAVEPDSTPAPVLARNPFEYGAGTAPAPWRVAPHVAEVEPIAAPSLPPTLPVRLVGFVQRAGKSRAALVIRGDMALLEVGESAEGFTLLAADEEAGVRLRGPDGVEIALAPEP